MFVTPKSGSCWEEICWYFIAFRYCIFYNVLKENNRESIKLKDFYQTDVLTGSLREIEILIRTKNLAKSTKQFPKNKNSIFSDFDGIRRCKVKFNSTEFVILNGISASYGDIFGNDEILNDKKKILHQSIQCKLKVKDSDRKNVILKKEVIEEEVKKNQEGFHDLSFKCPVEQVTVILTNKMIDDEKSI